MTQKFTAEEVRENIAANRRHMTTETELQLTAYADTLSKPADSGWVTGEMVADAFSALRSDHIRELMSAEDMHRAITAAIAAQGQGEPDPMEAIVQHCMVTEAVSPDSADPYGTISRVIDWHQANTSLAAQGQGDGFTFQERIAFEVGADECDPDDIISHVVAWVKACKDASSPAGVPDEWREFVERVSEQRPSKPDYLSSCDQCERNQSDAEHVEAFAAWLRARRTPEQPE